MNTKPKCKVCGGKRWFYTNSHEHEGQIQLTCPLCVAIKDTEKGKDEKNKK